MDFIFEYFDLWKHAEMRYRGYHMFYPEGKFVFDVTDYEYS
jgi:hypothetical protein